MSLDTEKYKLQGSFDNEKWIDLMILPAYFITYDLLRPYNEYSHFRTISTVTNEILCKAMNTGATLNVSTRK